MFNERIVLLMVSLSDVRARLMRMVTREGGQGIMEYSILLGGIALVAGAIFLFSGGLDFQGMFDRIQACVNFDDACN